MAGILARANSGEVSFTAATAKTALQIVAASNHRVKILGITMSGKSASPTDQPIKYRILRQTDAGTSSAGTAGTHLSKNNDADDETLQTAVRQTVTAEPTGGDVLEVGEFHPQNGLKWFFPFGQEVIVKGGGRLGIELTAPANQTAAVSIDFEE